MTPETALPNLLMARWLLPLASFAVISIGYSMPQLLGIRVPYATQKYAAYIAIGAIVTGFVLSSRGDVPRLAAGASARSGAHRDPCRLPQHSRRTREHAEHNNGLRPTHRRLVHARPVRQV